MPRLSFRRTPESSQYRAKACKKIPACAGKAGLLVYWVAIAINEKGSYSLLDNHGPNGPTGFKMLHVVSKPQIAFEGKTQPDEKAEHIQSYVSILKKAATQPSGVRWGFEIACRHMMPLKTNNSSGLASAMLGWPPSVKTCAGGYAP